MMAKGILGRKVGMTQIYDEGGNVVPVTVIEAGPCRVLQLRTTDRDGYEAVQMGFGEKPRRLANRSERGRLGSLASKRSKRLSAAGVERLPKPDCEPVRFIREFRGSTEGFEVGQEIKADALADVVRVDVIATSKGRGFAGVMKRHNFAGQRGLSRCQKGSSPCRRYRLQCLAKSLVQRHSHVWSIRERSGYISKPEGRQRRCRSWHLGCERRRPGSKRRIRRGSRNE